MSIALSRRRDEPVEVEMRLQVVGEGVEPPVADRRRHLEDNPNDQARPAATATSRARSAIQPLHAVGAANGRNPISIMAPRHRVAGASGGPGCFEAKRILLDLEAEASGPSAG